MSERQISVPILVVAEPRLIHVVRNYYASFSAILTKRSVEPKFIEILKHDDLDKLATISNYDCIVVATCGFVTFLEDIAHRLIELAKPVAITAFITPRLLSLPSAMELKMMLEDKISCSFFLISPEEEKSLLNLSTFIKTSHALYSTSSLALGVIDGYPKLDMVRRLNLKATSLSVNELEKIFSEISEEEVMNKANALINSYMFQLKVSNDVFKEQIRLYIALRRIVEKLSLRAILTPCPLLGQTPCLALSLLEEDGIITECYGNPLLFFGSSLLRFISNKPSFEGFISAIEPQDRIVRVLSCGKALISMAIDPRDIELYPQLDTWRAHGVTLCTSTKRARSTILKISLSDDKMRVIVASGETFPVMKSLFREDISTWPHIFIKLDSSPLKLIEHLDDPYVNITLGDYRRFLLHLTKLRGANVIVV
ncbi:MAG: hypothetical protein DRZ82_01990 [Thermoprotei archaeon]|nr:MAG: hypothetical protein DRZ82_01990 [Thermoprotei archaeon]